ncbi:RecBCD enzyme subunit RecB [Curvibacter sp. AEP1-3]|uniref:UvrD-helicase domain-containing protein n=1 Tax=Curvibacter sp. AEP1-3 TaxID=1844971 RepID=UPI000B3C475E|nr:UvrD-helicase domain-containing protein [Curvibacter sp. AEP1-3]ARV19530.1 RecBCD enzyme subunit RecB [Curvibacter sp. AEP1-3]
MSDSSVRAAIRSDAQLVVVEAPAGCGKTHQGADYANALSEGRNAQRTLILTHTHAACSVFADRAKEAGSRVEIATIDSLIANIAGAYHAGLGLPADIAAWVRQRKDGYGELALRVAALLGRHPMIANAIARRYPVVLCDEHQDSSGDQHAIVMALAGQGSRVRIFADPMQRIFPDKPVKGALPRYDWNGLTGAAQAFEQLDFPHRWNRGGCPDLGAWTLRARDTLQNNGRIDLRSGLPDRVQVVFAENQSQVRMGIQLTSGQRKPIDDFEKSQSSLLVLTRYNETARAIRAMFMRRLPIWEGHTRVGLDRLVAAIQAGTGDATTIAKAVVAFMDDVGKGFSPSAFGDRLIREVAEGCTKSTSGKPALIQELARSLTAEPNHIGVSKLLRRLREMKEQQATFSAIEIDYSKEFWEAVRLGDYESPEVGLIEITHRRTYTRPKPPTCAISTIHKAKGLECESVILLPVNANTFPDQEDARCLLYVALSRASHRLQLVLSRENPSPLFVI